MDELHTCDLIQSGEYADTPIGDVRESVETNLWLAEAYYGRKADALARECLRAAWHEYSRYEALLDVHSGPNLGDKLRQMIVERAEDILTEARQ